MHSYATGIISSANRTSLESLDLALVMFLTPLSNLVNMLSLLHKSTYHSPSYTLQHYYVCKVHLFEVSLYIQVDVEEVEKVEKGTKICVISYISLSHFCYLQRHVKNEHPPSGVGVDGL